MKVRIKVRPTGLLNGRDWPRVGETIDLPDAVAEGMISAGHAKELTKAEAEAEEKAAKKVETRPAPTAQVETRDVRAWATEEGIDVPKRGKIPEAVVEAYTKAHEES